MNTCRQLRFIRTILGFVASLLVLLTVSCTQATAFTPSPSTLPTPSAPDDGVSPIVTADASPDITTSLNCPNTEEPGLMIESEALFVPTSLEMNASDSFLAEAIGTVAVTTTLVNTSMCVFVVRRSTTTIGAQEVAGAPHQEFMDKPSAASSEVMIDQIVIGPNEDRVVHGNYTISRDSPLASAAGEFLGSNVTTSLDIAALSPWIDKPNVTWIAVSADSNIVPYESMSAIASTAMLTLRANTIPYKRSDPRGEIGTLGSSPRTATPVTNATVTLYSYEPAPNATPQFYPWSVGTTFNSTKHCYTTLNSPPSSTPGWIAGLQRVATTEATGGRKNTHNGTNPQNPQDTTSVGTYGWTVTVDRCYFVTVQWGTGVNAFSAISPLVGVVPSTNDSMEILDLCVDSKGASFWKKCSLVDTQ